MHAVVGHRSRGWGCAKRGPQFTHTQPPLIPPSGGTRKRLEQAGRTLQRCEPPAGQEADTAGRGGRDHALDPQLRSSSPQRSAPGAAKRCSWRTHPRRLQARFAGMVCSLCVCRVIRKLLQSMRGGLWGLGPHVPGEGFWPVQLLPRSQTASMGEAGGVQANGAQQAAPGRVVGAARRAAGAAAPLGTASRPAFLPARHTRRSSGMGGHQLHYARAQRRPADDPAPCCRDVTQCAPAPRWPSLRFWPALLAWRLQTRR